MNALTHILEHKIVAIIRGADPGAILDIVAALYEGGVTTVELTLNSENALAGIEAIAGRMSGKIVVGAGTVLDAGSAREAIDAGAEFIISPTLDPETIQATKNLGKVSMPGAFTPTEVLQAYRSGGDVIKVFPARLGVEYIRDLRGPLPHIPLMPTGGIHPDNIRSFLKAGAVACGIGTSLVDTSRPVTSEVLQTIRKNAARFVQAIREGEG